MLEHLRAQELLPRHSKAMDAAPYHEIEARPMPQATQQHRADKVDIRATLALAVAAHPEDVDIILYP